jgi:hypothetical protein
MPKDAPYWSEFSLASFSRSKSKEYSGLFHQLAVWPVWLLEFRFHGQPDQAD